MRATLTGRVYILLGSTLSDTPFFLLSSNFEVKMIDVIQWRASIGLWNCCHCTAGPTHHSIRTESPPGKKKKKTGSLFLSLIVIFLFLLIIITGYLEYNPPLTGNTCIRGVVLIHSIVHVEHCVVTCSDMNNCTEHFLTLALQYNTACHWFIGTCLHFTSLVPRPFTGRGRVWGHSRLFLGFVLKCRCTNQIASCRCCHCCHVT